MRLATLIAMPSIRHASLCILALSLLSAESANCGELSAVINGKSFHLNATEDWNENNLGFGVEYQLATESRWKTIVMANGFRDSSDNSSYMAGAGLHRNLFSTERWQGLYVDVGINAFVMTRSDVDDNRPFPGALPSLTIGTRHFGFNFSFLPRKAVEKLYDAHMQDDGITGIVYMQFKLNVSRIFSLDQET